MKKKGIGERLEDRQKANEKKRALVAQMMAAQQAKAVAAVSARASTLPVENIAPEAVLKPAAEVVTMCSGEALRLHQDHAPTALVPTEPLKILVSVYLEAASSRGAFQVLMWPVAPQVLPLVHAMATIEHWNRGNKAGLRGLLFPAKENTFYPFNHLTANREDLARHANALLQIKTVTDKDPVLFRAVNTNEVLPTLNDLLPHFARLRKGAQWEVYDERLLEHTLRKVNRHSQKAALRSNCAVLGSPQTAPDALFALGYQLDREDLLDGLKTFRSLGTPAVCLVNATRSLRLPVPNILGLVKNFVRCFLLEFPDRRPGMVIVTDDPGVSFRIREIAEKEVERLTKGKVNIKPFNIVARPIACQDGAELGQLLKAEGAPEPITPLPRKFRVEIKDAEAGRLVRAFYQVRNDLGIDEQSARPLTEAAAFIHKLAALPAGNRDLEAWLDEKAADEALRRKLAWSSHRGALVEFIRAGHAGNCEGHLEAVLKTADRLVENYFDATPMALALATEVGAVAGGNARMAIVFTRPMLRVLGERFLRRTKLANGKAYDDVTARVQLIATKQVREHARSGWATRYVFVGMDDEAMKALMTENGIPADSVLLLTQRTALYTRWTLKPIFEEPEFRRFKPRLEHILKQIDSRLNGHDVSLLRSDDFVLPSFDFATPFATRNDVSESWRIALEGGDFVFRSPGATVYVYDPIADLHSKSGFVAKEVRSLEAGEQLFVMSEALHDQVEEALRLAGVPIARDKPFEQLLREYHQAVLRSLQQRYPGPTLSAQVSALRESLVAQFPDQAKDFANVRHWVDLGNAPDTPFEQVRPQAPRHFKVFAAFASALGLSSTEARYFWEYAIHPIRVNRRIDGRYVSDVYARILFDPESAMVHAKLPAEDIANLFAEARRNVYTIAAIETPTDTAVIS